MKKFLCLIMAAILICALFASCSGKDDGEDTSVSFISGANTSNLKLAYSKNDSLDPYETESLINFQITSLVFDGLFSLDASYKPQPALAGEASVNGKAVSVTLGEAVFSDGTPLTAADVIASYERAKESDNFASRLENINGATISSDGTVVFTLERSDPYAVSCLNFPVVRPAADEESLPLGTGRYKLMKTGETVYLVANTLRPSFNPAVKTISLEPVHDSDSVESSTVIGNTAFFYDDLSSGTFTRINANMVEMGINNMVYLSFSRYSDLFSYADIRRAVSLSINRDEAVTGAFRSHARASSLPFNPDWYVTGSISTAGSEDKALADKLIEESGVDIRNAETVILYNNENEFKQELAGYVAQCLKERGFITRLFGVPADEFGAEYSSGNYDICISEVRLGYNMDLTPLFSGRSYAAESESAAVYNDFLDGKCEIMDFINSFNSDIPLVPVCFRNASLSYTNAMEADFAGCDADVFYDIESWRIR